MCTSEVLTYIKEQVKGKMIETRTSFFISIILDFNTAIICGIEAHACVLQTAIDLLSQGYIVYVVVDAVSSRSLTDR